MKKICNHMKDLIKDTVAKIKKQGIAPEPRWRYLLKKYGLWSLFLAVIFLGASSLSIAFEMLWQLDWDLYRFAHQSALIYSLKLIPYFWIILIGAFLVLAFFDLRKTETGYRFGWLKMSVVSIGGIIALSFVFSSVGLGEKLNTILAKDMPYYGRHMMMTKEKQWMQPENGFLAGTLTVIADKELEIIDLNGRKWKVFLDEKTFIRPAAKLAKGEMVKIIGYEGVGNNAGNSPSYFQAIEIRPWMGPGMMGGSGRGMMRGN